MASTDGFFSALTTGNFLLDNKRRRKDLPSLSVGIAEGMHCFPTSPVVATVLSIREVCAISTVRQLGHAWAWLPVHTHTPFSYYLG